jgi:hypothetical protein
LLKLVDDRLVIERPPKTLLITAAIMEFLLA